MLDTLLNVMKQTYMDLRQKFCIGKTNIWNYRTHGSSILVYILITTAVLKALGISLERAKKLCEAWKLMSAKSDKCKCSISDDEQHVFLATVSSIVFDLMSERIKTEKLESYSAANTSSSSSWHTVIPLKFRPSNFINK